MSNNIGKFVFFAAGLVLGSVVTWHVTKKKYEKIAQEEIDSVKEVYSRKAEKIENKPYKPEGAIFLSEAYEDLAAQYSKTFGTVENEKKGGAAAMDDIYVIPPEEFDENDYETVSLTYFSDGVLVSDDWEVITDIDGTIGEDPSTHFGEYEDDSVFVRNDKLMIDYEILFDPRKYSDVKTDLLLETASWE